jgi:RNA polymerase sigma factor (sigma-70 family)
MGLGRKDVPITGKTGLVVYASVKRILVGNPTDEEIRNLLIQDVKKGWSKFWLAYGGIIRGRVRAFHFSKEDTEDVLQDISIHLLKNDCKVLRTWDSTRSSLSAYLNVVAATRCLDFLKTGYHKYTVRKVGHSTDKQVEVDPMTLLEADEKSPAERLQLLQLGETINKCLRKLCEHDHLKPMDRNLVQLRALGHSFAEIAEILGIQEGNAVTRFSRLRAQLRETLTQAGVQSSDIAE